LTTNQTFNTSAASAADLWSWGTIPKGYAVNETGKLVRLPSEEWTPGI